MPFTTINKDQLFLWAFAILLITITLSDSRLGIFSIATPLKVVFIIFLFLGNLKKFLSREIGINLYKYFIIFFSVAGLSLIAGNLDMGNFIKTVTYFLNIALIPLLVHLAYTHSPNLFLRYLVTAVFGILIVGLLLKFAGFGGVYLARYRGLLGNPNGLGMFCLFSAIVFYLINYYRKNLFSKKYILIGWSIILLSLFYSNSRNSIIALGLFFIFSSKFFKFRNALQITVVVLSLLLSSFLIEKGYQLIVDYGLQEELRIENYEDLEKGSGRKVAHDFAKEYISNNFWVGKGTGTTEKIFKEAQLELSDEGHQGNAHNSFFTIWIDTGFIGILLFCLAWAILFIKVEKRTGFGIPVMIAVGFSAYFESYLASTLNPFTTLLLIILTLLLTPSFTSGEEDNDTLSLES